MYGHNSLTDCFSLLLSEPLNSLPPLFSSLILSTVFTCLSDYSLSCFSDDGVRHIVYLFYLSAPCLSPFDNHSSVLPGCNDHLVPSFFSFSLLLPTFFGHSVHVHRGHMFRKWPLVSDLFEDCPRMFRYDLIIAPIFHLIILLYIIFLKSFLTSFFGFFCPVFF